MSANSDDLFLNKGYNRATVGPEDGTMPPERSAAASVQASLSAAPPEVELRGRLADRMNSQNIHPVLVFGTRYSGKSTLLASLLAYIKREARAATQMDIGDWLVPTNTDIGRNLYDDAQNFYHHTVQAFLDCAPPPPTRAMDPYFIPVVLTPRNPSLPPIKLAFLESKGEWFHATNLPDRFQQFRTEIEEVLMQVTSGLSVIHVAPYSSREAGAGYGTDDETTMLARVEDPGLHGAITMYSRLRRTCLDRDRHLYLLTKWDVHTRLGVQDKEFMAPDVERMRRLLETKFPQSWTAFQNLLLGDPPGRRLFMQYSAGLIDNNLVRHVADRDRPALDRYPRTLWNWLYGNAARQLGYDDAVLYADVMPPPVVSLSPAQRLMRAMGLPH